MAKQNPPPGYKDMMAFSLVDALLGRRSRRFFKGAEIPDGVFAYKSRFEPEPLSELEKMLVVAACGGNTSWHHMHYRAKEYAPQLSNYAGAASGRTSHRQPASIRARSFSRMMRVSMCWTTAMRRLLRKEERTGS